MKSANDSAGCFLGAVDVGDQVRNGAVILIFSRGSDFLKNNHARQLLKVSDNKSR